MNADFSAHRRLIAGGGIRAPALARGVGITLIAMSGIRACDAELLELGLTQPGFVERGRTIASMPSLGLLTLAGMTPPEHEVTYIGIGDIREMEELPAGFDLVARSSFSAQINEAHGLGDRDRAAGVPIRELISAERRLLYRHVGSVTPGNSMKSRFVQPQEGRYDSASADTMLEMADSGGLTAHGHTLVWHAQCPDWFFMNGVQPANRELVLKRLRTPVTTTVGRYAGRVKSRDAVNEAMVDESRVF